MDARLRSKLRREAVVKSGELVLAAHGPRYPLSALPPASRVIDDLLALQPVPPLHVWLLVALEYYNLGRSADFVAILERTQQPAVAARLTDNDEEKLLVLNTLAAFHVQDAASERDATRRDVALSEVTKWVSRANRIENNSLSQTVSALSSLVSEDLARAELYLKEASEDTLAILLVKAAVHYNKGEFTQALRLYGKALRANPNCSAHVRFGLGLCYNKLDRRDMAEKCFARALQLDDSLVEPRVAMAVLKLNSGDLAQVQPAMQLFKDAYALDSQHPRVLNFFADHYTYRKDFVRVEKLAEQARINNSAGSVASDDASRPALPNGQRAVLAESLFMLARARHAAGDTAAAHEHYREAVKLDPENCLAQFGFAQCLLLQGDRKGCLAALERVLKRYPEDAATLRLMGTLLVRMGRAEEARETLQRAVDADATDPDTLLEFAQLLERIDPHKSLIAYRAALKLLTAQQGNASSSADVQSNQRALRNNVGVMHHRIGKWTDALATYRQVLGDEVSNPDNAVAVSVTTTFNLARLHEDMSRPDLAQPLYEAILRRHPTYTDCYLRLATMERARGRLDAAMAHLQHALTVHTDLPEALALQGNILLERREFHPAQVKFERILEKVDKRDPYALLSLGNIYYMARFEHRERKERYMKHAADSFWRVLYEDHASLYAANGLGMVFAEEGRLGAAGDIFTRVREGTNGMPDVLVNLAHVYMARGEFQKAITLYENALRKHYGNVHPKLLLYLARAHYEAGDYDASEEHLQRCVRLWPSKGSLWFNVALVKEAKVSFKLNAADVLPEPVLAALHLQANEAARLFEWQVGSIKEARAQKRAEQRLKALEAKQRRAERQKERAAAGGMDEDEEEAGEDEEHKAKENALLEGVDDDEEDEEEEEEEEDGENAVSGGASVKKARAHLERCQALVAKIGTLQAAAVDARVRHEQQLREQEIKAAERLRAKEEQERLAREAQEAQARELASIAERELHVLKEEAVHWKPIDAVAKPQAKRKAGGSGKRSASSASTATDAPFEPDEKKAKSSLSSSGGGGDDNDDHAAASANSASASKESAAARAKSSKAKPPQRSSSSSASRVPAPAPVDDGEDELEEWERELMSSKMLSLVQSKRNRDDREKRGFAGKRRKAIEEEQPLVVAGGGAEDDEHQQEDEDLQLDD